MRVEVHLLSQSQSIVRDDVVNTYTKDGLFCVQRAEPREDTASGRVEKYPLCNIFRVVEPY